MLTLHNQAVVAIAKAESFHPPMHGSGLQQPQAVFSLPKRPSASCPRGSRKQQSAMGRRGSSGSVTGAPATSDLCEELGTAWQCDTDVVSIGKETQIARLWAG